MSASILFHFFAKILFNMVARYKMPLYDKWTLIDFVTACCNIVAFNVIGGATVESILNDDSKRQLDYYVIVVLLVSWLRFFSLFLIIQSISKLLMTLIRMIFDTLSFMFICICFLLIMSSIFTILF